MTFTKCNLVQGVHASLCQLMNHSKATALSDIKCPDIETAHHKLKERRSRLQCIDG